MKMKLFAAAAVAVGFLAVAGSASASTTITQNGESVTITSVEQGWTPTLTANGFVMIDDFDSVNPALGYSVTGANPLVGNSSQGAAPKDGSVVDTSTYNSVEVGNPFTITDNAGSLTGISFYMSSPDAFSGGLGLQNGLMLTFNNNAASTITLNGLDIWGGSPAGNGFQGEGFLVTYTFAPDKVHSIQFNQLGGPAFEFDNLAAAPEPASWALMIMGFGAAGAMLRSRQRKALTA
jgi:hypothetical protein